MKNAVVQPYLFFEGKCEEAIEFYRQHLGAKVNLVMRYKDSPEPPSAAARRPTRKKSCTDQSRSAKTRSWFRTAAPPGTPSFRASACP